MRLTDTRLPLTGGLPGFASASLTGTAVGSPKPPQKPMTGPGEDLFDLTPTPTPRRIRAGTYQVSTRCANGHPSIATLTVTDEPVAWAKLSTEVGRPDDPTRCGAPADIQVALPDIGTGKVYHVSMRCSAHVSRRLSAMA